MEFIFDFSYKRQKEIPFYFSSSFHTCVIVYTIQKMLKDKIKNVNSENHVTVRKVYGVCEKIHIKATTNLKNHF